jgi:hypothetical protein
MASSNRDEPPDAVNRVADSLDQISRQLDAGLKVMLREIQGERNTSDMIRMLGALGCRAVDIAEWLRTPVTTVSPILSRMSAKSKMGTNKGKK